MRRFRKHFTYANTIASLALILSLTGTAYAAVTITGANVRNNTLTGIDVKDSSLTGADIKDSSITGLDIKNASIGKADLSAIAQTQLKGSTGPQGNPGPTGAPGSPAKVVASFASEDVGRYGSPVTANGAGEAWYVYNNDGSGGPDAVIGGAAPELNWGAWNDSMFLVGLTDGPDPGGYLVIDYDAAVSGTASITLVHHGSVHLRAECSLWAVEAGGSQTMMGDPVFVSSNTDMEIVSVAIVGTKNFNVLAGSQKTIDVQARCRDADYTTQAGDRWEYIRGNITAFAASEQ